MRLYHAFNHAVLGLLALCPLPFLTMAQSPVTSQSPTFCDTAFYGGCFSTAILSVCPDVNATACICGSSGRAAIGTLAGSCLISRCPLTEILAIGNYAVSACDEWIRTHTLTATGTGGLGAAASTATGGLPASTTFETLVGTGTGAMSITSSATMPTSASATSSTSAPTSTSSPNLSLGAKISIAISAFVAVCILIVALILFKRYRRKRHAHRQLPTSSPSNSAIAHELQTSSNIHELPDKHDPGKPSELAGTKIVAIPLRELAGFEFPFQKMGVGGVGTGHEEEMGVGAGEHMEAVEADSRSARAGHPRGRQAGTEATVFDFESQKVLLEPGVGLRGRSVSTRGSGGGSASAGGSRDGRGRRGSLEEKVQDPRGIGIFTTNRSKDVQPECLRSTVAIYHGRLTIDNSQMSRICRDFESEAHSSGLVTKAGGIAVVTGAGLGKTETSTV